MIKYCKTCLLPSTKPYIKFDTSGICKACLFHKEKNKLKNLLLTGGKEK